MGDARSVVPNHVEDFCEFLHGPLSNDLEQPRWFWSRRRGLIGFVLCCLMLMVQAAVLDGLVFDVPPFSQDGFAAPEFVVSRGQVADALVAGVVCNGR
jgi:hypothetical protein